jgi:hypothetical protein
MTTLLSFENAVMSVEFWPLNGDEDEGKCFHQDVQFIL